MEPSLHSVTCPDTAEGHRMAYWQWGDADAEHTIVCAHGLTRQGRDFDVLAQALLERANTPLRIICPDVVGRGMSDWLKDPMAYVLPTYAADMLALLAQVKPKKLDWLGTSMGGLIGLAVCAHAGTVGASVRRLVLNDVGPTLEWQSLVRIGSYLGKVMHFASLEQAAGALWLVSSSFGPHTPAQWLELSRHMVKPDASGGVRLHYDPAIAQAFSAVTPELATQGEAALWALYDGLRMPTLLVRGAQSDLLSSATALQMTQRGPKAQLVEFAGVGHAPTFVPQDQINAVASFLLG